VTVGNQNPNQGGDAAQVGPTSPYDSGTTTVGALDSGVKTKLSLLPQLTNVVATLEDDSAEITFDPFDGALDYRVYPLPNDNDISTTSDGHVVIQNAIYRCAGTRETPAPTVDNGTAVPGSAIHTQVDQQSVGGFTRTLAGATLGYVYTQPGPGLVPVYALGESDPNADNSTCIFARWRASRSKVYTTSASERSQLLANFARDDGIAFYVPASADSTTTQAYFDLDQAGMKFQSRYYFVDGQEASAHPNKTAAFPILASSAPGTQPLMRVFYANQCGWSHDELAVGTERFNRVYRQGDAQPWWSLLWTGVTAPTTLVVEALDSGCPYQGLLAAQSSDVVTSLFGSAPIIHQPFLTIDGVRSSWPTHEVFINGQQGAAWNWDGEGGTPTTALLMEGPDGGSPNQPKAIARSFVQVAPNPHPKMDFFAGFSPNDTPETFTPMNCGSPDGNCYQTWRQQSPTFDQMFISIESGNDAGTDGLGSGIFSSGPVMGELWVAYADKAGDTNGKYRLTARQSTTMSDSSFLHVTMEVDAYSTSRRYPQILITDQAPPVQYALEKGHTLVVQPRAEISSSIDWPVDYQLEVCNLRTWDVNQQCPVYDLYHWMNGNTLVRLAPNDEVGEHSSADHRVLWDVFTSTQRTYLFLDGQPYACADLPNVGVPIGTVWVTWGDVLYHSAVDHTFAFHAAHQQVETRRHFDNLGFSANVPAPTWDESRLPCAPPITP
jgi:hypothetical protein